jgi:hypothetical protein
MGVMAISALIDPPPQKIQNDSPWFPRIVRSDLF